MLSDILVRTHMEKEPEYMPVVHALFEIQYDLLQDLKPSSFVEVILCEYRSFQLYIPRTQCLCTSGKG